MDDFEIWELNGGGGSSSDDADFTQSDVPSLEGNGSLPVVSDVTTQNSAGGYNMMGSGGSAGSILGSINDAIKSAPAVARDIGTIVGNTRNVVKQSQANYNAAQSAAASNNQLATWWLYASTTDKLLVGLTVLTIVVMVVKKG